MSARQGEQNEKDPEHLTADEVELPVLVADLTEIMKDAERQQVAEIVLKAAIAAKHFGQSKPKGLEEITSIKALRDKLVTIIGFRNYPEGYDHVLAPGYGASSFFLRVPSLRDFFLTSHVLSAEVPPEEVNKQHTAEYGKKFSFFLFHGEEFFCLHF